MIKTYSCLYKPGQNILGHLRKLGTKIHFVKLTHILPLKKAWGCCYRGPFLLSPTSPSSVDCAELKLECIRSTLHRGGRGEGRCLNLMTYCISVPRVLTRVAVNFNDVNILCPSKYLLRRNNEILLEPYNGKTKKTISPLILRFNIEQNS